MSPVFLFNRRSTLKCPEQVIRESTHWILVGLYTYWFPLEPMSINFNRPSESDPVCPDRETFFSICYVPFIDIAYTQFDYFSSNCMDFLHLSLSVTSVTLSKHSTTIWQPDHAQTALPQFR